MLISSGIYHISMRNDNFHGTASVTFKLPSTSGPDLPGTDQDDGLRMRNRRPQQLPVSPGASAIVVHQPVIDGEKCELEAV